MNKQVITNASISVAQVILSSVLLFVVYKYLIETLGIEKLGIWSIIVAITSVSQVGGFGLGGSVIKFISKYLARNEVDKAVLVIETAFLSIGLLIGVIALLIYQPLAWSLAYFLPEIAIAEAASLLPITLLSFWLTSLGGVFLSGLYGCQRVDLRGMIMIAGLILNMILIFSLVPHYGILGLAYAQFVQAIFLLVAGLAFLMRQLPGLSLMPVHWDRGLFREMIGYGVNFQLISIVQMLMDPLTKALLSKFGGLAMVGYFEMANSMVRKFQAIVVSANQVAVPLIASRHETSPEHIDIIYEKSQRLLLFIIIPFYSGIAALIPILSQLWIGHTEMVFIIFSGLSAVGLFLNTLAGPAYFSYLGSGFMRWCTLAHITMGILNGLLGISFGWIWGGIGVVLAWMISVILGSSIIILSYHIKNGIPFRILFPLEYLWLFLSGIAGMLFSWLVFYTLLETISDLSLMLACTLAFLLLVILPVWWHPMRSILFSYFIKLFAR